MLLGGRVAPGDVRAVLDANLLGDEEECALRDHLRDSERDAQVLHRGRAIRDGVSWLVSCN